MNQAATMEQTARPEIHWAYDAAFNADLHTVLEHTIGGDISPRATMTVGDCERMMNGNLNEKE